MLSARLSRRALGAGAAAAALAVVAGCKSDSDEEGSGASGAKDKVTYLTGFQDTAREQYARVADAKGYFAENGIEVNLKPGQPSDFNTKALAANQAQFAAIDFVSAATNAAAYPNYRIISAIQDRTLLGVVTFADANITSAGDLAGKTIGAGGAKAASKTLFPAYAKLANLDPKTIKWQLSTPDQLATLLAAGRVDAITQYVIDQPTIAKATQGKALKALSYSDYLNDLYGTVIITSNDMIKNKPDLVRRFAAAITKGTRYSVDHPDEAAQIMKKALPPTDTTAAAQVMTLMKPYVKDGTVDDSRTMRGIAVLASLGLVESSLKPENLLAPADLRPKAGAQ